MEDYCDPVPKKAQGMSKGNLFSLIMIKGSVNPLIFRIHLFITEIQFLFLIALSGLTL